MPRERMPRAAMTNVPNPARARARATRNRGTCVALKGSGPKLPRDHWERATCPTQIAHGIARPSRITPKTTTKPRGTNTNE